MVTFDPTNLIQNIINSVTQVVETSSTASNMINNFKETIKMYEQGKKYYDALNSVNNLVKDARKDQQTTFTTSLNNNLVILSRRRRILFRLLAKVS